MQGYGKEVYITESDYSQYVKLDGKEYEISSSSYYDDETGNSSKNLKVFDTNNKTLYSYNEFSNLDDFGSSANQDIFRIDEESLKKILGKDFVSPKSEFLNEIGGKIEELKSEFAYPLQEFGKKKDFTINSLIEETAGYVIQNNIENFDNSLSEKEFKEKINKEAYDYIDERMTMAFAYCDKEDIIKEYINEFNINENDFNKKMENLSKEDKKEELDRLYELEIEKMSSKIVGQIDEVSPLGLGKSFSKEIYKYNENDFKFKDEVAKKQEELYDNYREKIVEKEVKNGFRENLDISKEELNDISYFQFSNEDIERLNKNYLEKNNLPNDEEYADKIYNQDNIKEYNPLSIIDEYPEIKAEVLERLPFDFGEVLPPFQVYNSNEMFYDSGTQELGETTETFMKSLIGEMAWDFMNVDNIIEWYQVAEEHPNTFKIVYFEKNDKGEYDDNSIKDFTCYNDYADYSEKAIKESLEDTLRHNPSLYKRIEENVIAVQKEAGVYQEKTFGDVKFHEITDKKEEVKEKEEVKNMKGYGKEVYITENDDTTERIINGKKYIIETTSYYDDETGDSSFKIVAKNENGSRVYEYSEYSDFDNYDEECYQDTSIVDDEFLKELNKTTNKKLPTQEEIENKYSKKEVEQETDKEDSKLQNLKDYLENAVNVENEIDKFSDKMEVIVDKLNLIDKLPVFKVMTEEGILYSSDKGSVDFQDKDGNMVYERTKLFDEIKDKMGEEFFNNMNMNDIRDWENFKNNSDITLVYDSYGEEGDYRLKEYSDFNSYAKETIKPFLVQEISKNPELGDILKENIIKDDKVKENNKEIKEKEVAKDDREMDF